MLVEASSALVVVVPKIVTTLTAHFALLTVGFTKRHYACVTCQICTDRGIVTSQFKCIRGAKDIST